MTHLLQRGRLEVSTDLLLGAEEVLLPAHFVAASAGSLSAVLPHGAPVPTLAETKPSPRGFDAALFESGAPSAANPPRPSGPRPSPPVGPEIAAGRGNPAAQGAPTIPSVRLAPASTISVEPAPIGQVIQLRESVIAPSGATKAERLAALDAQHARACPHCTTATAHTRLVFGEGNPEAELVFVGEAPGETEDQLGRPFVGRAGEKLDEMIGAMGLARSDVYIANVLKSRPPDNRTPLAHEVERCGPYLLAQLSVIRPKVIVTLGGPATKLLLASELGITRLRGVLSTIQLGAAEGAPFEVPVMPTFHPAYLLRNYTVETRSQVWEDLKKVLSVLGRPIPTRR